MGASVRVSTIDWSRVIDEIRGDGTMVKDIARKAGIAPQTLHNIYTGATKEPCYSVGVRLLEMRDMVRLRRPAGYSRDLLEAA
jgi:hypothetical protein